ncbi:MAG: DUF1080 domain-containing protein [Flavitalea sp.]
MKKEIILWILFFSSLLNIPAFSQGTLELFNGKDLNGWYAFIKDRGVNNDPRNVFTVQEGMIHISGEEFGCITTDKQYGNYQLSVEYKWGAKTHEPRKDKARDGGILLHSQGVDGGYSGTWMHSIECQLIEGGSGDILVVGDGSDDFSVISRVSDKKNGGSYIYDPNGRPVTITGGRINWYGRDPNWKDELNFRGSRDAEYPVGEWNKLVCRAAGDSIAVYLNGILVNQAMRVKPQKGKIQIQSEGAELFVKSVVLKPLE